MEIRLTYGIQTKAVISIIQAADSVTHVPLNQNGVMAGEPDDIIAFAMVRGNHLNPIIDFFNNNSISFNYPEEIPLP